MNNRHLSEQPRFAQRVPSTKGSFESDAAEDLGAEDVTLNSVVLRRSENRFRRWAIRATAAFLAVYMLGIAGVPTLVPYLAVLLAVIVDAVRLAVQARGFGSESESNQKHGRRETIH